MKFWMFNIDTCQFEQVGRVALANAALAVVNDGIDVQVVHEHEPPKRWPSGECLVVAGVEFERELFE